MKLIEIDLNYSADINSAVALGNFDGVHKAHQELLKRNVLSARKNLLLSSVLLFKRHSDNTVNGKDKLLLTDNKTKIKLVEDLGIDIIYFIEFSNEFMSMSADDFISKFLIENLKIKGVTLGFDYTFGRGALGKATDFLKFKDQFNFVNIINPVKEGKDIISSTLIRNLIMKGNVLRANELLTRPFTIVGKVVHGNAIGNKNGYPTANLKPIANYVLPEFGVYDTDINVDGKIYKSVTNVGINPTLKYEGVKIESHILDFDSDIYSKEVSLMFNKKIRDEIAFSNISDLFDQIRKDVELVKNRK